MKLFMYLIIKDINLDFEPVLQTHASNNKYYDSNCEIEIITKTQSLFIVLHLLKHTQLQCLQFSIEKNFL